MSIGLMSVGNFGHVNEIGIANLCFTAIPLRIAGAHKGDEAIGKKAIWSNS